MARDWNLEGHSPHPGFPRCQASYGDFSVELSFVCHDLQRHLTREVCLHKPLLHAFIEVRNMWSRVFVSAANHVVIVPTILRHVDRHSL
jgi:hypothetical protein